MRHGNIDEKEISPKPSRLQTPQEMDKTSIAVLQADI